MSGDLADWLRAQLDEDERVATDAESNEDARRWFASDDPWSGRVLDGNGDIVVYDEGSPTAGEAMHIARHDPARVLAEVDAKRHRLETIEHLLADDPDDQTALHLVALEALPYAGRPGYRQEWAPDA